MAEETGVDLAGVPLSYLESEFFITEKGERQVTVTFVAHGPARGGRRRSPRRRSSARSAGGPSRRQPPTLAARPGSRAFWSGPSR